MNMEKALIFIGNFYLNENRPDIYPEYLKIFKLKVVDNKKMKKKRLLAYPYDDKGKLSIEHTPRMSEMAFGTDLTTLVKVWKIIDYQPSFKVDDYGCWTCSCDNELGTGEYKSIYICEAACFGTVKAIIDYKTKMLAYK